MECYRRIRIILPTRMSVPRLTCLNGRAVLADLVCATLTGTHEVTFIVQSCLPTCVGLGFPAMQPYKPTCHAERT
jgi:hypothetical protein